MYCSISGAVPEEPVVSKVSGHLFERRLLEKAVADTGVDPITKSPMTLPDDAVVIRSSSSSTSNGTAAAATTLPPKPRPSPANSVPGLIGLFRDEWDALALETHQLRGSLHQARQELAHALYQHDAALRVIARLVRERDAARDAYEARGGVGGGGKTAAAAAASVSARGEGGGGGDEEPKQKKPKTSTAPATAAAAAAPPPEAVVAAMSSLSDELSKARRKRTPPQGCATAETVKGFAALGGSPHAIHRARNPGVTCVATAPVPSSSSASPGSPSSSSSPSSQLVASGGNDGDVCLFDAASRTVRATFAHSLGGQSASARAVTDVAFVRGALLATAGADGAVRLWRPTKGEGGGDEEKTFYDADDAEAAASASSWSCAAEVVDAASSSSSSSAAAAVVAVAVHPSRDYFAAAGADGEWRLYDVDNAAKAASKASTSSSSHLPSLERLVTVPDAASGGYSSASFHPDGLILGIGTIAGAVRVWDARTSKAMAKLEGPSSSTASNNNPSRGVTGVSFSENGYYLATGASDGVRVWDLRKLRSVAAVAGPGGGGGDGSGSGGGGVSRLSFDPSGYLLAVAGPGGVSVLGTKQQWAPLCEFTAAEAGAGEPAARRKAAALSVAWSGRGDALYAGGGDNTLRCFGLEGPPSSA